MTKNPNRLLFVTKLTSGVLKEYKYNLTLDFQQCLNKKLIISLAESQMIASILDITHRTIDREYLETLYQEIDHLKKSNNKNKAKRKRIKQLQDEIYSLTYIPEYITVVMESKKDYERMFKKGFIFNGKKYTRGSCSASQARVSTIVFVQDDIKEELLKRLNNGRDVSHPLAPSKYNAYLGLYSSASRKVTKPRFCIMPDYCEDMDVDVSWSIETDWALDDIIEDRTITNEFNRFDGSGLISPSMAKQWAEDLGEDYVPCQFCIRYAFTKGLVNEFDFVEWCRDELEGVEGKEGDEKYFVTDIYGQRRDLREIDVILTEGMAKLWDSWESQEIYEKCCEENKIDFRVTKYVPKQDKIMSLVNYQYLQTLNLDNEAIESFCQDTIDYIQGVSYDDVFYTLLFCLGQGMDEYDIQNYMSSSDNYWIKSMILNHEVMNDKYSREKVRDMIVTRIEQACLGRLMARGNYQPIVPDSYSFMQWITGQEVTGLLNDGEFYSQFWANRGVDTIACERSPLTYVSEHVIAKIPGVEKNVDNI